MVVARDSNVVVGRHLLMAMYFFTDFLLYSCYCFRYSGCCSFLLLIPLTFIIVDSFRYKKYLFPIYLYFLGFSFGFLIGVQLFISINDLYFYFFAGKESQRRLTMSYL